MKKVITYGTFDKLHYGHIRLLERAKKLGDYLIVGVTADDYDVSRGKINVQQTLMERIDAVKATGLADEIIVEEYEGQKIDDIKRYGIDIFTVGSDWKGYFDYLNEYCKVVYLDRTQGVSSSEIRAEERKIRMGFVGGNQTVLQKYYDESKVVNGLEISGVYFDKPDKSLIMDDTLVQVFSEYDKLLDASDALYIVSKPSSHYQQIKEAILAGKHVLCESPITLSVNELEELYSLAEKENVVLMEAIKTAYSTAYNRLLLMIKSGKIGDVVSIDSTCTSLRDVNDPKYIETGWSNYCMWAPTAMLPIFQILGTDYKQKMIVTRSAKTPGFDEFTHMEFIYDHAVATAKVGACVKSEGELVIAGTKGYVYVPAPWWKTDYFEIRYENPQDNKRYFYQLDGEGIRYELVSFVRAIVSGNLDNYIDQTITAGIVACGEDYLGRTSSIEI